MMLKPLEQWICDKCGEIIETPDDGYVLWKNKNGDNLHGFEIIHRSFCDNDDSFDSSMHLSAFLGIQGVNLLMSLLSSGQVKLNLGQGYKHIVNLDDFVDFFRRVQVPYYEEARQKFNDLKVLNWHSDGNELTPYTETALMRIIEDDL